MTELARFISGDGVEHEVEVGSPAFDLMAKTGSFKRLDEPTAIEPDTTAAQEPVDLSKMTKAALVAEAEARGVTVVPDDMTKAQIIAAIEAGE